MMIRARSEGPVDGVGVGTWEDAGAKGDWARAEALDSAEPFGYAV